MLWCSTATASYNIYKTIFQIAQYLWCHLFGSLVVLTKLVWQSCIGIGTNIERHLTAHLLYIVAKVISTEGAIYSDRKKRHMANRSNKCIHGLTRKGTITGIRNSYRHHHGKVPKSPPLQFTVNTK